MPGEERASIIVDRKSGSPVAIAWLSEGTWVQQILEPVAEGQIILIQFIVGAVQRLHREDVFAIRGKSHLHMSVAKKVMRALAAWNASPRRPPKRLFVFIRR